MTGAHHETRTSAHTPAAANVALMPRTHRLAVREETVNIGAPTAAVAAAAAAARVTTSAVLGRGRDKATHAAGCMCSAGAMKMTVLQVMRMR